MYFSTFSPLIVTLCFSLCHFTLTHFIVSLSLFHSHSSVICPSPNVSSPFCSIHSLSQSTTELMALIVTMKTTEQWSTLHCTMSDSPRNSPIDHAMSHTNVILAQGKEEKKVHSVDSPCALLHRSLAMTGQLMSFVICNYFAPTLYIGSSLSFFYFLFACCEHNACPLTAESLFWALILHH